MSASGQTICRLAGEAAEAPDPEAALTTLARLREELAEFDRQQVPRALTAGGSFGTVAKALGASVVEPARVLLRILRNGDRRAAGALA